MSMYDTSQGTDYSKHFAQKILPIDNPTYFKSPHTLFKWRHIIHAILFANCLSRCFYESPLVKATEFFYFTVWTETSIWLYFFLVIYLKPINEKTNKMLVNMQHAFLLQETIVVMVFWGVLFPFLGLGKHHEPYFVYINIYKHTFPFLSMVFDFLNSYGEYSNNGAYICMIIYSVYFVFMNFNHFVFDITPYPTPLTDCKSWLTYATFVVTIPIFYIIGLLFKWIKDKNTGKTRAKKINDDQYDNFNYS